MTTSLTFARHASPEFNARMQSWLDALTADVRQLLGDNLVGLVLGGGYGRGEGGVLVVDGEERPYNDLDFTLIVQQKSLPVELDALRHKYAKIIGIEVDFSRPLTIDDLRHWPPTLMWTDLLNGHHVLYGPVDILTANTPDLRPEHIPLVEGLRLMLNRGAGLVWAMRVARGCETAPDRDFVRRNFYKAALALGDTLLIAHGRFATPYTGRDERLAATPCALSFDPLPLYKDALTFKFWPGQLAEVPDEARLTHLARHWGEVLLYTESRRAGNKWADVKSYCAWPALREPEQNTLARWPRNIVRNRQHGYWSFRYPRERLYRELPVLLGLCESPVPDWPARGARFLSVWKQVN
jgi:hypothetical protein